LTSHRGFANFHTVEKNFSKEEVMRMSNLLGIIISVVVIIVGIILLVVWWSNFVQVLMGIIPILLVLIGAGALIFFISEIKSKLEMEKEKPSPEEKKAE
jgi:uncharacterized membrane protein YkgB